MSQSKIYVGNLSYDVTSSDLNDFFAQYGEISEVKLITDRDSGRSKGFAFISFAESASAQSAIDQGNGVELKGRAMKVNMAKEDGGRRGGGGRNGGGAGRGGQRQQSWESDRNW